MIEKLIAGGELDKTELAELIVHFRPDLSGAKWEFSAGDNGQGEFIFSLSENPFADYVQNPLASLDAALALINPNKFSFMRVNEGWRASINGRNWDHTAATHARALIIAALRD